MSCTGCERAIQAAVGKLEGVQQVRASHVQRVTLVTYDAVRVAPEQIGVQEMALAQARLELAERRQKVEVLDRGLGEMERRRSQIGELLAQRRQEVEVWGSY